MILGLTGTNGAGKTSAADWLRKRGFRYESLSDEIRLELEQRGLPATRDNLTRVGNELRASGGAGVLAQRIKERLEPGVDYVIDSIRNPQEAAELRQLEGFRMVHFDAPRSVRFQRAVLRDDERAPSSLSEFVEQEERELSTPDPTTQQLLATFELADETIFNDGSLEAFERALERLVEPSKPSK